MEFWQIKYFVTLAEYKNFTKAAHSLFITQPSLSQQIAKLEKELDTPLLKRTNRNVQLTPAGEVFLEYAKELLDLYDKCRLSVEPYRTGQSGHLIIMTLNTVEITFFPSFFASFSQKYPNIDVEHTTGTINDMILSLKDQTADIAISISFADMLPEDIIVQKFNDDRLVLAVAEDSPYNYIQSFDDPDIANILNDYGFLWSSLNNKYITDFLQNYTHHLKCVMYEDISVIISRVLGKMGYAVIPEIYLDSFQFSFHKIPVPNPTGHLDISMIYHSKNENPCAKLFLKEAIEYLEKHKI